MSIYHLTSWIKQFKEHYDKYLNELLDINGNTTDNIFSESEVGKNWINKNL
jgi:hypothetical protein